MCDQSKLKGGIVQWNEKGRAKLCFARPEELTVLVVGVRLDQLDLYVISFNWIVTKIFLECFVGVMFGVFWAFQFARENKLTTCRSVKVKICHGQTK